VQHIDADDLASVLNGMRRDGLSEWTRTHVFRVMFGVFSLAVRRGYVTKNPLDGLADGERPTQKNAREVRVLVDAELAGLIAAGGSERWRAALGLAAYAGLRIGEIRALTWGDIDLDSSTLAVSRSALSDGTCKAPKTEAGVRRVTILPELRRLLVAWKLRSPFSGPRDLILCGADGKPVAPENCRRALAAAKRRAGLIGGSERLSWHSLRHSYLSTLIGMGLPVTTAARLMGHTDPSFTLRCYARDARDDEAVTADVLERAAAAGVGQ